ncbi:RagB/SusD family nutrient uptake outer membrane protein [Dyadobacter frigoris]|uniref:RagB/SusD family nutrient uptake outer membrane protein n=1 Tax=Dyadobacter frigoris TaxID=2576211 RepID=A0A4U6CYL9_9BACT|nr:RagB/SusD family nutrient uptake outer membrane protein [Dyadobacter frigoris]TKT88887.1 RagB/SusD family nutrient uptake outer membrane protein [Dyadobacter frigoris]GLU56080.1 membrane protein [Dyadobacter frigoris]
MKKYQYILLAVSSLFIASCNDFLTEKPESIISEEQYYKTETDAITAINAVYFFLNSGKIQTPYNTLFNTGMNMASDDEDPGPGATNPDVRSLAVQSHSSSNLRVYELWQQHYAAIRKANVVLNKIPGITFSIPANKDRILAEAKFLRALFYFNLVRLYGDVPLITEYQNFVSAADYAIAKSPSADVYAQIEKDLTEAAAVLPVSYSSPDVGRATAGAAKSLLAKVYLIKASLPLKLTENYQKAISKAEEALSAADGGTGTYGYDLITDYSRVFLPAYKNGVEHIFSAQMKGNSYSQGNNENPRAIYSAIPGLTGNYAHIVRFYTEGNDKSFSIYKLFKATDKRRNVTFVRSFTSPANGRKYALPIVNTAVPNDSTPFWNKWWDPNNQAVTSNSEANVPIIRYAELLLIHAEAENEVNGPTTKAYKSINRVRTRAGLAALTQGLTKDQFRDSVYFERRLELTYEYQRWFDLIREKDAGGNGILIKSLQKVGKNNAALKHYLYPIPQTELDNNPLLKQNTLWQ